MAHVLIKNFSANVFGQCVNVANTFFLVPLFLSRWGVTVYGEWLVLIALPAYFMATADAGFVPVSGNDMTIKYAQGERARVVSIFQSTWIFMTLLSLTLVGAISAVVLPLGVGRALHLSAMPPGQIHAVLLLYLVICLLNFQQGLVQVALRAVGRFAEGTAAFNVVALLEFGIVGTALFFYAAPAEVAVISTAMRTLSLLVNLRMLRRYAPWLHYGIAEARKSELKRLLAPSLAIMGIPAGNAMMLQGIPLILNFTLGPAAVALFSITRTMTRIILQVIGLLSWSSWPEISRHYGSGRSSTLAQFLTHGTQLACLLAVGFFAVMVTAAPFIFSIWTAGRLEPDRLLVAVLTITAAIAALRAFPSTIVLATNQHMRFSIWYVIISAATLAGCYVGSRLIGTVGAAASLACGEIAIMLMSFRASLALIGEGAEPLWRVFSAPPPLKKFLIR
jgi:O-antigen/teichoic acid export membrane protein